MLSVTGHAVSIAIIGLSVMIYTVVGLLSDSNDVCSQDKFTLSLHCIRR